MSNLPASAYEGLGLSENTIKILTTPRPPPKDTASPNVLQAGPQQAKDLAMNETSIVLYAELLLNIRTVTLFASLGSAHDRETVAKLSSDGHEITVTHEGESATIRLPIKAEGGGDASLSLPANPPRKELSLRLQIEEEEGSELFTPAHAEERRANLVPWDGTSLNGMGRVSIVCKECQEPVVKDGNIKEWRDLPNENWAEMMDFWHCHKPDEHHLHNHTHEETLSRKGYAAASRLQAAQGIGFVDLLSLLLDKQDFGAVEVGYHILFAPGSL
jgi:ubiquitin-protein ligase E3 D